MEIKLPEKFIQSCCKLWPDDEWAAHVPVKSRPDVVKTGFGRALSAWQADPFTGTQCEAAVLLGWAFRRGVRIEAEDVRQLVQFGLYGHIEYE